MRDVIWTIIGVWVVYRLYNAFFSGNRVTYEKHEHHHYDSEPKIIHKNEEQKSQAKKKIDDTEYTDFEEIQ